MMLIKDNPQSTQKDQFPLKKVMMEMLHKHAGLRYNTLDDDLY